jgi:hypothetical protein
MTANEDLFAKKIAGYLDRDSALLRSGTAYRLQLARAKALDRLADAVAEGAPASSVTLSGAHGLAGGGVAGGHGGLRGHPLWSSRGLWIGIALIIVGSVVFQQWRESQAATEIEETDAAILSSELPIDAYLDRGFHNWLKQVSN